MHQIASCNGIPLRAAPPSKVILQKHRKRTSLINPTDTPGYTLVGLYVYLQGGLGCMDPPREDHHTYIRLQKYIWP